MTDTYNLARFLQAQQYSFDTAMHELRCGRKTSHWMWYIFPQMRGLGRSSNSGFYGMTGLAEAQAYLAEPVLGERLRQVCAAILDLPGDDAVEVFGGIDARKLRSSMTLFDLASPDDIFSRVLDKYYGSRRCRRTLTLLRPR